MEATMRKSPEEVAVEEYQTDLAELLRLRAEREVLGEEIRVLQGAGLGDDRGVRTLLAKVQASRRRDRLKVVEREIAKLEQRLASRAAEHPELALPNEGSDPRRDLLRRRLAGARLELGRIKVLLEVSPSPLVRQARLVRKGELERLVDYYERTLRGPA